MPVKPAVIYSGPRAFRATSLQSLSELLDAAVNSLAGNVRALSSGGITRQVFTDTVRGNAAALPGITLECDTVTTPAITISLGPVDPRDIGLECTIVRLYSTGTVTLSPFNGAKLNGSAASRTLPATAGSYQVLITPRGYWLQGLPSVGVAAIQPFAADANTVGLWPLNGTLANSVDATNPLTVDAGTEIYTDIVPGKQAFFFSGGTRLRVSAFVAALAMTGDLATLSIWQLDTDPTASTILLGHGAAGELAAANILYSSTIVNAAPPRLINFLSESGAGVDASYTTAAPSSVPPIHNIMLVGTSRTSGVITNYINGRAFGAASGVLTTPTGGGSGRFYVGASDGTTTMTRAVCWGVMVQNVSWSAAQHLACYNATLGQGFGQLT